MAKLVDARDLKSLDFGHAGSTPAPGTKQKKGSLHSEPFFIANNLWWRPNQQDMLAKATYFF